MNWKEKTEDGIQELEEGRGKREDRRRLFKPPPLQNGEGAGGEEVHGVFLKAMDIYK